MLSAQIAIMEKRLQEKFALRADYALLTAVRGIGQTLVTMMGCSRVAQCLNHPNIDRWLPAMVSVSEAPGPSDSVVTHP
ncbi:hypothetical protein B2G74_28710 [Burkholderia sp. A27]|jgi:hypothetical protein|nr:hypothetical protein B2G74_28710 [Burkholderia sp. A27]